MGNNNGAEVRNINASVKINICRAMRQGQESCRGGGGAEWVGKYEQMAKSTINNGRW